VVQLNLLEFEVISDGVEGGKRLRPLDEDIHVIKPLVQALLKVKNEVTIDDGLIQGMKVVSHALHPVTVVADDEVAFFEGVEPSVELRITRLVVAEELSLDHDPCLAQGRG
jgi:hypothetical protein